MIYFFKVKKSGVLNISQASLNARLALKIINDPSAGSPTETLLRLLLPLNDQVWPTSQQTDAG